jgi:hypothetical protein
MKLGLMQPYLFPYIGYFQLIAACDLFVVYDDVQFIKGGWINRNRILAAGNARYITLPLEKDHLTKPINERRFTQQLCNETRSVLSLIEATYRKAPFFMDTMDLASRCLESTELNVAIFVSETLRLCCRHLEIKTPFRISSSVPKAETEKGEARVISLTKNLGADHYLNPIGGAELYSKDHFRAQGLKLSFLKPREFTYLQFADHPFFPWLSILDVLMFNSVKATRSFLGLYDLV